MARALGNHELTVYSLAVCLWSHVVIDLGQGICNK